MLKAMTAYVQKFAGWIGWGSLGVLISIIALFLAIDFKKADVHMFILSDTDLVDIKSPLNDLQILYNGNDLLKEHLNLHLYRIQVQNTGNTILLKDAFDDNDLWGVHVSAGAIVKTSQPNSDSSYIQKNLAIQTPDQMTLRFTPIIFEPGDSFILDFFVLLRTSSEASSITSVGKIAGLKQIPVTALDLNRKSLLYEAYLGDWEVLALRILAAPVYIILFGVCIWGLVGPTIFIISRFRRRKVKRVLKENGIDLTNPEINAIKETMDYGGKDGLDNMIDRITRIVNVENTRKEIKYNEVSEEIKNKLISSGILAVNPDRELVINPDVTMSDMARLQGITIGGSYPNEEYMLSKGILSKEDGKIKVNKTALEALTVLAKAFGRKAPNIAHSPTP